MKFQYYDLGTVEAGSIVEVTLGYSANVRIMDSSDYSNYKAGRAHHYLGGHVTSSPYRAKIPRTGHWHVVVDLGGYSGKVSSSVSVIPG